MDGSLWRICRRLAACLLVLLWPLCLSHVARGELVGSDPAHARGVLAADWQALEHRGFDVLQTWSAKKDVDEYRRRVGEVGRRLLAPLEGYGSELSRWEGDRAAELNAVQRLEWMRDFKRGVRHALAAVPGDGHGVEPGNRSAFEARWDATPDRNRWFISYTAQDGAWASQLRLHLEAKGYVVFTYLNEAGSTHVSAEAAGRIFATAGQRVAIDSPAARRSLGVRLEASSFERMEEYRWQRRRVNLGPEMLRRGLGERFKRREGREATYSELDHLLRLEAMSIEQERRTEVYREIARRVEQAKRRIREMEVRRSVRRSSGRRR